ncbi:MAG: hypothetical protein ACJAUH_002376, partial [Saprospiraceae bacterium]
LVQKIKSSFEAEIRGPKLIDKNIGQQISLF